LWTANTESRSSAASDRIRDDPDHPAHTSDPAELLGDPEYGFLKGGDEIEDAINIGCAENSADVRCWLIGSCARFLPSAGPISSQRFSNHADLSRCAPLYQTLSGARRVFVSGSASAYSRELIEIANRHADTGIANAG